MFGNGYPEPTPKGLDSSYPLRYSGYPPPPSVMAVIPYLSFHRLRNLIIWGKNRDLSTQTHRLRCYLEAEPSGASLPAVFVRISSIVSASTTGSPSTANAPFLPPLHLSLSPPPFASFWVRLAAACACAILIAEGSLCEFCGRQRRRVRTGG